MSGFLNNILTRHLHPEANIIPRLPGKFEPVNAPLTNTSENFAHELVTDILTSPVINTSDTVTSVPLSKQSIYSNPDSNQPNFQQMNNKEPVSEISNTIQPSNIEKIIPVSADVKDYRQIDDTVSAENFYKQELSFPLILKPLQINSINEPALNKVLSVQGTPGLINDPSGKAGTQTEKADLLNQNISLFRQRIKQNMPGKNNNVSEISKSSTGNLIQPAINTQPTANNLAAPATYGEQIVNSVIKISIGRIDVRAVTNASPVKLLRNVVQKPNLTLDDYLKKRNGAEK